MPQLNGGCPGGAVRYASTAESITPPVVCHCRDCQRFTGSAFGALVVVPMESLTINGTMKTFVSPGGSGRPISRHFCPDCGSSIALGVANAPESMILHIGTLDEPKSITPVREIFCDDALPWLQTTGDMQRFPKKRV